jgi:hypothetical protein
MLGRAGWRQALSCARRRQIGLLRAADAVQRIGHAVVSVACPLHCVSLAVDTSGRTAGRWRHAFRVRAPNSSEARKWILALQKAAYPKETSPRLMTPPADVSSPRSATPSPMTLIAETEDATRGCFGAAPGGVVSIRRPEDGPHLLCEPRHADDDFRRSAPS